MHYFACDENGTDASLKDTDGQKIWILNLPGGGINIEESSVEKARDMAGRSVQKWLPLIQSAGLESDQFALRAVYYERADRDKVETYNKDGKLGYPAFVLAKEILSAKLKDSQGQRYSFEEAENNLRKLVMFGRCYGGILISELEKAMLILLRKNGYNPTESLRLMKAPKAVVFEAPLRAKHYPRYFDTLMVMNCSDTVWNNPQNEWKEIKNELLKISGFEEEDLFCYRQDPQKWRRPEKYECRLRRFAQRNLLMMVTNAWEMPTRDHIETIVKERYGVVPEDGREYYQMQKRLAGGHDLSTVLYPPANEDTPFMEKLSRKVWRGYYQQLGKAVAAVRNPQMLPAICLDKLALVPYIHGVKTRR